MLHGAGSCPVRGSVTYRNTLLCAMFGCHVNDPSFALLQVTIPANHSAVALLKLAQLPYNGASSLFIRVLLNKKYALPYKVCPACRCCHLPQWHAPRDAYCTRRLIPQLLYSPLM